MMSILILVLTGFLCTQKILQTHILIVLESTEIPKFIGNKNITKVIYRKQANDSIRCGYFCVGFTDFMFKDKRLTDFINLFSLKNFR